MTLQKSFTLASVFGSGDASGCRATARSVCTLSLVCVVLGAVTASTATAQRLAITKSSSPPQQRKVTFEEMLAGSIVLEFTDYDRGEIDLYQPSTPAEARGTQSCRLTVVNSKVTLAKATLGEPCRTLLAPLWKGEVLKLAVRVTSREPDIVSLRHAVIEYDPPRDYQGPAKATTIELPRDAEDAPDWQKPAIPKPVTLMSNECYVHLDRWRKLTCDSKTRVVTPDPTTANMLAARWHRGGNVELIARVTDAESEDAWRAFQFKLAAREEAKVPAPPTTLEERCKENWSADYSKTKLFYLICVDATMARRGVSTLSCKKQDRTTCRVQDNVFDSGRDFIVVVWTDKGARPHVVLGGIAGKSELYDPSNKGIGQSLVPETEVLHISPFSSRKAGTLKLTVTVPTGGEPIKEELDYTIRASYRAAIRLGLGISWAPWARKVGIRTAANGQRYAAVVSGADDGLVENELVAGYSFFLKKVKQDSLDVSMAIGLRLGVVDIDSGAGWFRSLMVGPELAIGQDFAIGIFGGIRRVDLPDAGYEPGRLLGPDVGSIPTHVGVTPAFGVVLNFTPGFLDSFGKANQ